MDKSDQRTPGLFKTEYSGSGAVALCSKTYICYGETTKISTKGLNKKTNSLEPKDFKHVLTTKQPGGGVNMGFKTDGKTMYTYKQHRQALTYFYIKRKIQPDGVSTTTLDI